MYLTYILLNVCVRVRERKTNGIYTYIYLLFISVYSNSYDGGDGGGVGGEKHNIKWVRPRGAADAPT